MKILILANHDLGLYRFQKELIYELLKEHTVIISLPYGELVEPLIQQGCIFLDTPVERRGINPIADMQLLRRYWNYMREFRPNLCPEWGRSGPAGFPVHGVPGESCFFFPFYRKSNEGKGHRRTLCSDETSA